jgi:hypothetical protein
MLQLLLRRRTPTTAPRGKRERLNTHLFGEIARLRAIGDQLLDELLASARRASFEPGAAGPIGVPAATRSTAGI